VILHRRQLLPRDPPYDFIEALADIQTRTGWGIPDLMFVLNVSRGCIRGLLAGSRPDDDLGQAIRKLRASCAFYASPSGIGLSKATDEADSAA
jgi:hypothetical protein